MNKRPLCAPSVFWQILSVLVFLQLLTAGTALPAEPHAPTPVILISVDTLRADHLNCYGYRVLKTLHIDAIARGGTLFTEVNTQVPLTLPSHVSLLTSTYPFWNGVEDNAEPLPRGAVTLATVLKSRGYGTAAFVGGFVLDRQFGLDQGFDVYDSPFDLRGQQGIDPTDLKRTGEEVSQSAAQWLEKNPTHPCFVFLVCAPSGSEVRCPPPCESPLFHVTASVTISQGLMSNRTVLPVTVNGFGSGFPLKSTSLAARIGKGSSRETLALEPADS